MMETDRWVQLRPLRNNAKNEGTIERVKRSGYPYRDSKEMRDETKRRGEGLTGLCVLVGLTNGSKATIRVDQRVREDAEVSVTSEVVETIKEGDHFLEELGLFIGGAGCAKLKMIDDH